jgi:hypothetical protein
VVGTKACDQSMREPPVKVSSINTMPQRCFLPYANATYCRAYRLKRDRSDLQLCVPVYYAHLSTRCYSRHTVKRKTKENPTRVPLGLRYTKLGGGARVY